MQPTYEYTPLSTARSTQVIEVLPALINSATVVINMHQTQIDHVTLPYEAVSYTWGSQVPDQPIECHQKRLYVTKNADDILRRLRRPVSSRHLWIDAICIDQMSEQDKYRQVAMMADIYRKAKQVFVWLGHVAPGLPSVYQEIQTRRKPSSFLDTLWSSIFSMFRYGVTPKYPSNFGIRLNESPLGELEGLVSHHLDAVLQHPYWQRAWTAQEFALNKNCTLYFSEWQISKKAFRTLLHMSEDKIKPFRLVHLATWLTATKRSNASLDRSIDLTFTEISFIFECLPQLRSYLPVDRVFALVSVYPRLLGGVTIDYGCKPAQVYTEAAMCSIQSTGHLSILSFAGGGRGGEVADLASWMPDWSMTRAPLPVGGIWLQQLYQRMRLTGSIPLTFDGRGVKLHATRRRFQRCHSQLRAEDRDCAKPEFDLSRTLNEGILQVKGVFLAEIGDAVSDVMEDWKDDQGVPNRELCLRHLDRRASFLSACAAKFGPASLKEQLITCMVWFEKYFKDYVTWTQALSEATHEDCPVETSISPKAPEAAEWRTWVTTCVDELARDYSISEDEQQLSVMIYMIQSSSFMNSVTRDIRTVSGQLEMVEDTETKFRFLSRGQRLFMTTDGSLGVSERVEQGDKVVLMAGCDKPFIIRQEKDAQTFNGYRLIGEAYLNDVQDGQKWPTSDRDMMDIFLV